MVAPVALPDRKDASSKVLRTAVGKVVTRDRRDDDVTEPEPLASLGHPLRLVVGDRLGFSSLDGTEAAWASAGLAEDHECGRAPGPAFRAVGTAGTLADGLQAQFAHEPGGEVRSARARESVV